MEECISLSWAAWWVRGLRGARLQAQRGGCRVGLKACCGAGEGASA